MTNKRAKPDSGITMDDVDGFSAAELFGQGASSSASPPPRRRSAAFETTRRAHTAPSRFFSDRALTLNRPVSLAPTAASSRHRTSP